MAHDGQRHTLDEFAHALLVDYREMVPVQEIVDKYQGWYIEGCSAHEDPTWTSLSAQQVVLNKILDDAHCRQYPPSRNYRMRLLKQYIEQIELSRQEEDERLARRYLELAAPIAVLNADTLQLPPFYKTYQLNLPSEISCGRDRDILTVKVSQKLNVVGLTTWDAGFFLSEYILSHPDIFRGKRILELGSGVGIVGTILWHYATPRMLICSDYEESVLQNLRENLTINGSQLSATPDSGEFDAGLHVVVLDWENPSDELLARLQPEIIVASDVVYDPILIVHLVRVLRRLLDRPYASTSTLPEAIIASTVRNLETWKFFIKCLKDAGIAITHRVLPKIACDAEEDAEPMRTDDTQFGDRLLSVFRKYENRERIALSCLSRRNR